MSIWRHVSSPVFLLLGADLALRGHVPTVVVVSVMVALFVTGLWAAKSVRFGRKPVEWDPERGCSSGHSKGCPHRAAGLSG